MYSFSYLEPVWCSMSSCNCCFLTCIQISQEAGKVVWYSHLFKNFPQFDVASTYLLYFYDKFSRCEVISHCDFGFYFPDNFWYWTFFHIPVDHLYPYFRKKVYSGPLHIFTRFFFNLLLLSYMSSLYMLDTNHISYIWL